ncbi:hypothetical protein PVAND_000220 [Polypedilum vanderplanki]|uniref:RanBP2-type domain-containing protein n=1 Tax=Polypedilum vanderplanki TaxID=319348 RepID=A0A9J6BJN0_POLVA|nr:hypothetical protein PVAND_000220 [Polypedilum vanderplanki]
MADQTPLKSTDQRRLDQNNNISSIDKDNNQQKLNVCNCTNISIMQLFHEMKQEFPKVPDHIVHQLVTENCHNRRACLEQLQKVVSSSMTTPTMYPSKSIHNNNNNQQTETKRSPIINGTKSKEIGSGKNDNSQMVKQINERFENISISSSSEATSSDIKIMKRPTTLPLRRAPDPPTYSFSSNRSSPLTSATSTPSSTTSVSSFSTATTSSQMHHNVILDSSATKTDDSLNVQLNVKVSPISTKRPAPPPPPPVKPNSNNQRFTSHLSVQPEPPYTSMLDPKNNMMLPFGGGAIASTGTTGQRSYTNVKLTLRQPSSSSSSSLTPIDIQAGPQTLSYSSSSFNAQQGSESHLKITVAGNGESCIQAVRTAKNVPEINQIDTTINIEGNYLLNDDNPQYRIISNPFIPQIAALPQSNERRLTEDELRQLIKRQMKQKESLECELEKEREKLQMIRLDIITLTKPVMTHLELRELCDEITRLQTVCTRLSNEIDVVTSPPRAIVNTYSNAPPPIPKGLVSRKGHSPSNSLLPHLQMDTSGLRYPTNQPPSYHDVMRGATEQQRLPIDSNLINDDSKWTCTICTFQNHSLLNICETCEMPRVQAFHLTDSNVLLLSANQHHKIIHSFFL